MGMTDRAFAISCGISQTTLWKQLNGTRELSLATVNAIIKAYPEISLNWLFRGIGDMLTIPRKEAEQMDNDRVSKLIDTIAFQQMTINDQSAQIKVLKEDREKLSAQVTVLKNERNVV